jgi:hypothetical protein
MITLTCSLRRRARPKSGGVRYDLQPAAYQVAEQHKSTLSLDLAHVSVFNYKASSGVLELFDQSADERVGKERACSSVRLGTLGHLTGSLFLSEQGHDHVLCDLELALLNSHLNVAIHFSDGFDAGDAFTAKSWIEGTRFGHDHVCWSSEAAQIDLVVAHR